MKCRTHLDNEAIGLCKHCHRFICEECLLDTGWGIVCSKACADELEVSRKIVSDSEAAFAENKTSAEVYRNALIANKKFHSSMLGTWLLFFAVSVVKSTSYGDSDYAITFGVIFFVFIIFSVIKIKINANAIKILSNQPTQPPANASAD
ncbi:hypothetical protein ORJ04_05020 [Rheinheimera baltica]|uniref:B box-type domain-containing protein n=1 Tax=Rheinheimera baltica TaxID=67576 RepID=A0ABT9HW05_9GAMM|nr:hypothetical protein [Rheinheimera baltica]MDP5135312.1 hypothetical protein [Rheinheimera baltica]